MSLRIADGRQNLYTTGYHMQIEKRVIDYFWQQLQKLFEPFQQLSKGVMEHHMQIQ